MYDYRDPDWRVVRLTRAGHHLWALRRRKADMSIGKQAIDDALEAIWSLKRELKAEIEAERRTESAQLKAKFARRAA